MCICGNETDRIIRLPEVIHLTGESRTVIYTKMSAGYFPRQRKLGGGRSVGWSYLEVMEYVRITLAGGVYLALALQEQSEDLCDAESANA